MSPTLVWIAFFATWLVLVSGVGGSFESAPGVVQAWRIYRMKEAKRERRDKLRLTLQRVSLQSRALRSQRELIRREIRTNLGYIANDELIFVFDSEPAPPSRVE